MRTAIAEYDSFREAQQAVRTLESKISTQDIVIAGKSGRLGPDERAAGGRNQLATGEERFVVFMSGVSGDIARASALLRERSLAAHRARDRPLR